ncbi:hypothetical protein ABFS83_14G314200 [Erythranthe nasuta]
MDCRRLELTIVSANNLEQVRRLWGLKMNVHARVFIGGLPEKEKRTPTDTHGKRNPVWNHAASYTILESMLQNCNTNLDVHLYCTSKTGDIYIGQVNISLKELFDAAGSPPPADYYGCEKGSKVDLISAGRSTVLTLPVHVGCAKSQGALRISYSFGEKVTIDNMLIAESVASLMRLS